ncbi:MAG TPA: hypothetical protein VKT80_01900, partial [Chloroflexota bacterium]|nr:hypothetical protein [Chloroflexota bacterium]
PGIGLGVVALPLSIFSLFQTLRGGRRVWPRRFNDRSVIQRLVLVVVALAIYGLQFYDASQLVLLPASANPVGNEINLLFALYAFAIGRSWELIGARRGILSSGFRPLLDDGREQGTATPPRVQPSVPTENPSGAAGDTTKDR